MFSGEITPDEIWDYVLNLPRNSATWAAVYADPETVIPDDGPAEIPLTHFSPEVELLADIYDAINGLRSQVIALVSKTPPSFDPHRRPGDVRREAAKARRHEQARAEWNDLLSQMGVEH